ncbi:hypothetical protein ABZ848_21750 [Streptomyces sp. NPDC047081]|uniref:hypothetical protein n=1 Tax=Streptomyces sp. NPDC047081 TaxID=3154706 RepID=UPI0033D4BAEA
MTTHTDDKLVIRRPKTGWSKARDRRGAGNVRTCLPAVLDDSTPRTATECNIVRGED